LLQIGANEYKWVQNAKVSSNTATIMEIINCSPIKFVHRRWTFTKTWTL